MLGVATLLTLDLQANAGSTRFVAAQFNALSGD
jgi:hypothetical protein